MSKSAWIGAISGLVAMGLAVAPAPAASARPPVKHVFVLVLENEGYSATFGNPAADPYLARTLPSEGALLRDYYGTGHVSNDNYIAMVSGQAPNPQNQGDCPYFDDFVGTGPAAPPGQAVGTGCVYPASVPTIGNQLTSAHLSWKAYMQDMGNVPSREAAVCGHPTLNSQDKTETATAGDGYVSKHDPFVYFHSVIDQAAYCKAHVVPLSSTSGAMPASVPKGTTGLAAHLRSVKTTPNLSFITPNVCSDGHDYPCVNQPSGSSALADTDAFLRTWVPLITSSPAFRQDGMLAVIFDEAGTSDASSCCGETPGPDSPLPGIVGPGGGRTGAVLISPFIKGGTVSTVGYNHYSLLASIETFFGLPKLGMAQTTPVVFGRDVFAN